MSLPNLTPGLAEAVATADPLGTPGIDALARQGLLDFLACALAGSEDPGAARCLPVLLSTAGAPQAPLFGQGLSSDMATAALFNGYIGHALDFDDVHASVRGHPSTVLLPALLALAGHEACSGLAVLAAYVVGIETMGRIGLATGSFAYDRGWHHTATLGAVGAAAACAHLLRLPASQVAIALGLGATQSCGLQIQFGTDTKPLHAGLAARAGLQSALWARSGLGGSPTAFDGCKGYLALFGGEQVASQRLLSGWGQPWQIAQPGLDFKRHACCNATHYAGDAALSLQAEPGFDVARVRDIEVILPPGGDTPLRADWPTTGLQGRFSLPYVVAIALQYGELPVQAFADQLIPEALDRMMRLVHTRIDLDAPPVGTDPAARFSEVQLLLDDGQTRRARVQRPQRADDSLAKFVQATGQAACWREVPELVDRLDSASDLRHLLGVLQRAHSSPLLFAQTLP